MKATVKIEGSLKEARNIRKLCEELLPALERHLKLPVFVCYDNDPHRLTDSKGDAFTLSYIKQHHGSAFVLVHSRIKT